MTRIEALVRIKGRVLEPRTLFVEHGYVATTIRDVARAAGVGERTVYHGAVGVGARQLTQAADRLARLQRVPAGLMIRTLPPAGAAPLPVSL